MRSDPLELRPKLAGFDVEAYLATATEGARQRSCLLCGSRHEPRIYAWCERLVRCADGRNHELVMVSLICAEAKRQHKQYTKRMLPWFVIPECKHQAGLGGEAAAAGGTRSRRRPEAGL